MCDISHNQGTSSQNEKSKKSTDKSEAGTSNVGIGLIKTILGEMKSEFNREREPSSASNEAHSVEATNEKKSTLKSELIDSMNGIIDKKETETIPEKLENEANNVKPVEKEEEIKDGKSKPRIVITLKSSDEVDTHGAKKTRTKDEAPEEVWTLVHQGEGKRSLRSKPRTPDTEPAGVKRSARRRSKDSPRESVLQSAIARKEKSFSNLGQSEEKLERSRLTTRTHKVNSHRPSRHSPTQRPNRATPTRTAPSKPFKLTPAVLTLAQPTPVVEPPVRSDEAFDASGKGTSGSYTKTGKRRYKPFKGLRYSFTGTNNKKAKLPRRQLNTSAPEKTKPDSPPPPEITPAPVECKPTCASPTQSVQPPSPPPPSPPLPPPPPPPEPVQPTQPIQPAPAIASRSDSPVIAEACQTVSQKRKLQPDVLEDDAEESGKRGRQGAMPSPSPADSSQGPAKPESTAISSGAGTAALCLCGMKPQLFITCPADLYCQAVDTLDGRSVGCCNLVVDKDVGLARPGKCVAYQILCEVHTARLLRHSCCPCCGLFCTQGKFVKCPSEHLFHRECQQLEIPNCLHCGVEAPLTNCNVTLHSSKNPIFLPQQKPSKKAPSAKMCFGGSRVERRSPSPPMVPADLLRLPSGQAVTSEGLPPTLDKDKLEELLSVACSMVSTSQPIPRYSLKSLYHAARLGNVDKLLSCLACGLNPNHVFREHSMSTALHAASSGGHLLAVHVLMQAGAQLDVMDRDQNTALMLAAIDQHNKVVKYLVKAGASVILKGNDGMTALHLAAKAGNLEACHYLLSTGNVARPYIDSVDDGGWTPLVWAAEHRHTHVAKHLLRKRADPLIRDAEHNVALHWAAFSGSVDISEMLLNCGVDVNSANVHGDTPLHIGARQNMYNCVLLLLARGAKVGVKNGAGDTPSAVCTGTECQHAINLNVQLQAMVSNPKERTRRILTNDISRGKELNPVQCVNGIDEELEPSDYVYVSENCFTSNIAVNRTITSLQSCLCRDQCGGPNCRCAHISLRCWYDEDGRLLPEFNYADPPMLFECNQACACNKITCNNRVVQHGLTARFQLFRTWGNKGWGVRTLRPILKGSYVCEYIGEIISDCEADHREDDSYLFDLDNRDGETYCIDARHYGNVARFINHMCVPNLLPVRVYMEHQDTHFPRIAFFANRDIAAEEELGFDYGEKFWIIKCKSFTCTCGTPLCRYSETTIVQTLDNYNKRLQELERLERLHVLPPVLQ